MPTRIGSSAGAAACSAAVSAAAQCATVRWDDRLTRSSELIQAVEAAEPTASGRMLSAAIESAFSSNFQ